MMTLVVVDKGVEVGSKRTEPEPRQRTKQETPNVRDQPEDQGKR